MLHTNHEVTATQARTIRAIAAARTAAWTFLYEDAAFFAGALRRAWLANEVAEVRALLDDVEGALSFCVGAWDAREAIRVARSGGVA